MGAAGTKCEITPRGTGIRQLPGPGRIRLRRSLIGYHWVTFARAATTRSRYLPGLGQVSFPFAEKCF